MALKLSNNDSEFPLFGPDHTLRRFCKEPETPRVWDVFFLATLSWNLGGIAGKPVPGGPFIKVSTDLFPFVAGFVAIVLGVSRLRKSTFGYRLLFVFLVHLAAIGVGHAIVRVYSFWTRPFARGNFWDW